MGAKGGAKKNSLEEVGNFVQTKKYGGNGL